MIRAALAAGFALALAACQMNPPQPDFPVPRYTDKPPIRLDVASIAVDQPYQPPMKAPNVEHEAPVSPAAAAKQWAADRLTAAGDRGTARVLIETASIVRENLKTDGGVSGWFITQPATRYTAKLTLTIELKRPRRDSAVSVTASRTTGVPEGATLNERDTALYELVRALMNDAGGELAAALTKQTEAFVVGADA